MPGDSGLAIDLQAVAQILREGDVITIGFTTFAERLLVDTRANPGGAEPLVAIVDPVANVQERFAWLGKHRSEFGMPKGFSFFVWPGSLRALVDGDVLDPLRSRLAPYPSATEAFEGSLRDLQRMERDAIRGAIRGDSPPWHTFWSRSGND